MTMKPSLRTRTTDLLLNSAAAGLAFTCAFFAGLMILRLERMENPPADLGLNFKIMDRKQQSAGLREADPEFTGSIDRESPRRLAHPETKDNGPKVTDFRLLSVVDGVAFVEIAGPGGKEIWPVGEGAVLPGAGRVLKIERDRNRWEVTASHFTITGERQ
jgi:hypothetical protein